MPKSSALKKESTTNNFVFLTGSKLESSTLFQSPNYAPSFTFPYNPDPLVSGNDYKIYDEMTEDDQIKSTLAYKKNFVINTGWEIQSEEEEIKKFVTDTLNNINAARAMESSFEDILEDMLSSYPYGFSLSEPIYALNEENKYIYKSIKTRPPHSFRFELDKFGNVEKVVQSTIEGEKIFAPDKFLHHVYQQSWGNPYGKSDLSAAHASWKAKKFVMRFMVRYLEKFGSATVVGRYDPAMTDAEISSFQDALETIQNNTSLIIPDNAKLDFLESQKDSSDAYQKALQFFNTCIARALLVPDLMGLSGGQTSGGSFSLGLSQFEIFLGTIKKDRNSLAKKITNKLVQPLVDINFGKQYKCKFVFVPFTEQKMIEYAKTWMEAIKGKLWKPNDAEIHYLRKLVGFPEGEIQEAEQDVPAYSNFNPGGRSPTPKKDVDGKAKEPDEKDFSQSREINIYEKKVNFAQIETNLNRFESSISKKLSSAAKDIYSDYINQIRDKNILNRFVPEKVNDLQPKFLKPMNALFKGYFQDLFADGYSMAQKEILPNFTVKFSEALLPEEFLEVLNSESFKLTGDYVTDVTKKAKNILVDGLKNGASQSELLKLLRQELDENTERWLQSLVRTKTTEIYNSARRSYWENDPIAKQLVTAYEFSAVLDSRTSEICGSLDGNIYEIADGISRVTPPLHFNCRSLLVPITKFEDYEAEKIPIVEKIQYMGGNLKNFCCHFLKQ